MDVLAAAHERNRTHGDALYLCAGQPSTPAPRRVLAAAEAGLRSGILGYTEAVGVPALREAVAAHHREAHGTATRADDVIVTTGSSGGFTLLFLAALDAGDDVVLARPGYPAYRNALLALGANVVEVDCGAETRFQLTADLLAGVARERGRAPKAVIVTSPDNPTGTIIDAGELRRIAQWCEDNGCLLISDEIYHGISYGRTCASARSFSDAAVVVGSVSKYFSMTGWRIGWLIVPDWLKDPLDRLAANMTVCPPAVSQVAAVEAFHPESLAELDGHVRRYADNRALLLERLPEAGLGGIAPPDGGFYVYADVSHLTGDSLAWSRELLDATGVAVAPGVDFDPVAGGGWVRLCFAGATADMAEACRRIAAFTGA
ncbi:aminotransferase class I/II-fold pyridoxal phosphate-dependent enzyme [Corynebacterium sp. 335C]